jgi:hypothetical protein
LRPPGPNAKLGSGGGVVRDRDMSKFLVNSTFALERRRLFVLAGSITEGQIRAGMIVNVPLNSSLSIAEQIQSIEFIRRTDGREDVCLCIAYESSDELEMWKALNLQNEMLDVVVPA